MIMTTKALVGAHRAADENSTIADYKHIYFWKVSAVVFRLDLVLLYIPSFYHSSVHFWDDAMNERCQQICSFS